MGNWQAVPDVAEGSAATASFAAEGLSPEGHLLASSRSRWACSRAWRTSLAASKAASEAEIVVEPEVAAEGTAEAGGHNIEVEEQAGQRTVEVVVQVAARGRRTCIEV